MAELLRVEGLSAGYGDARVLFGVGFELREGRSMALLYVGKVGVDDPVEDWIAAGWVKPAPVPSIWEAPSRPGSGSA